MKDTLTNLLKVIVTDMGVVDVEPLVESPADLSHGDYTTNVALVAAKMLRKNPLEVAELIVSELKTQIPELKRIKGEQFIDQKIQKLSILDDGLNEPQDLEKIEIAPPGFINFYLSLSALGRRMMRVMGEKEDFGTVKSVKRKALSVKRKKVMVEFAHPNTHKAFHIGHLRNISTGESIVRLLESQEHEVIRANYQGDVGMHIAKALYALLQISNLKSQIPKIRKDDLKTKVEFLGKAYAAGSKAFEEDKKTQEDIKDINYLIYAAVQRFNKERGIPPSSTDYMKFVHGRGIEVTEVYELWKETRQWSLDYFETIYKRVGSRFQRYYFESECLTGVDEAKVAVNKGVLAESDGAIIFNGKPYGLDTRVFVNSLGLPTYEAKELALAKKEFSEFGRLDKLIHVVGPEQASFFQVTFKAEELLELQKEQQYHLIYGWVRLKQGKMSSRSGNVVLGEWLIDEAKKGIYNLLQKSTTKYKETEQEEIAEKAAVAAVKYSFLKVSTKQEIVFDLAESVSFEGDSGPYLQYTYARCKSVLRKADDTNMSFRTPRQRGEKSSPAKRDVEIRFARSLASLEMTKELQFNNEELLVLRQLYKFSEIVSEAAQSYSPNILCKYLYELASTYNTFYNKHSILGVDNQEVKNFRLAFTEASAQILKNGLFLLGIEVLERM